MQAFTISQQNPTTKGNILGLSRSHKHSSTQKRSVSKSAQIFLQMSLNMVATSACVYLNLDLN